MSSQKNTPKDTQVMGAILKDMGIMEYEPRVINQMLEFTYRYVTNVLDDARLFSSHAKKRNIDIDDVRLAIQLQMDRSFTTPPPRDLLLEIARQKNSTPLPLIKASAGPRLPPDRYTLTTCNYKLKPKQTRQTVPLGNQRMPPFQSSTLSGFAGSMSIPKIPPAIPLNSKIGSTLAVVTKPASSPSVTIVQKMAPSLTRPNIPMPSFKISSGTMGSSDVMMGGGNKQSHSLAPSDTSIGKDIISRGIKREREDDDYDAN